MQNNDWCIRLAGDVIRKAISDLRYIESENAKRAAIGRDAYRFLKGKGLDAWCFALGLDANRIRKEIGKNCDLFK